MTPDTIKTVTKVGYGARLGASFSGIIIGLLLFIAGTVLLYWNEGRAVSTGDAIAEAKEQCVELPTEDLARINPEFNGKLVHATGALTVKGDLEDPAFLIKANAVSLTRDVQYFQWIENKKTTKEKKAGGEEVTTTVYSYEKKWTNSPVDSSSFQDADRLLEDPNAISHKNVVLADVKSETFRTREAFLGAYQIPPSMIGGLGNRHQIQLNYSPDDLWKITQTIFGQVAALSPKAPSEANSQAAGTQNLRPASSENPKEGNPPSAPAPVLSLPDVTVSNNVLYLGCSAQSPKIGCVKVSFSDRTPGQVSIIAQVAGNTFEPFIASNGESYKQVVNGTRSLKAMIQASEDSNSTWTWILRGAGVFCCILGLRLILGPIAILLSFVPILETIAGAGATLLSGLLGTAWSLIIIGIAWIRFRPLLGAGLLGGAAVVFATVFFLKKKKLSPPPAEAKS